MKWSKSQQIQYIEVIFPRCQYSQAHSLAVDLKYLEQRHNISVTPSIIIQPQLHQRQRHSLLGRICEPWGMFPKVGNWIIPISMLNFPGKWYGKLFLSGENMLLLQQNTISYMRSHVFSGPSYLASASPRYKHYYKHCFCNNSSLAVSRVPTLYNTNYC